MVRYKGQYNLIQHYMLAKPVHFGIKVWTVANAIVKYIWTFKVYCGKDPVIDVFAQKCKDGTTHNIIGKKGKEIGK